ncbi:MAG: hypothetical protein A3J07_03205 [Candidatus Doudnabacteria bacterium RIFCSPLOWO2_02_FULL_49_13]|uniref:CYTH domain-containing protein n=1 Tax=Candidatus Doudnabacteria bacterium RIFCSPHIGHO2_12_FULL_48_16 TaxID=1817838 RepID=A0A1F5PJ40_9BACT|nr:MAG: hypothetical protein A3B77_02010 [Candidatus Doudnabacteria bacterium RIFCSPHIGHO2_02_FULL_49_24]OGE89017.1 MAG: hypothetical protein A2760_00130 [Candidatus Doudnabacteria bacterium RIFCSPHIGHO2_01_FULL_50_67]OGE89692.1 MAG: hypothetical protein A3E29_00545 [Candidatus Doudnabacteria bacterium RIFCSPHIGHO2_12_FULL_48_16]OGE97526.1 MAG: hypothetical protein A2990_02285 [Candidatus Doudnabacteria bacterium RIFCSPLOWO2_01_FULL_49_40]OGF03070.1 MAG: hypothetical protein A3J07_03205 [Candid
MAHEIETKILGVDKDAIISRLTGLGAEKILQTRFMVRWFRPKGTKEEEIHWFLRIRSGLDGNAAVTWKGPSEILGVSRKHKEINFDVSDPDQTADLFEQLGLEQRAYQEKDRISWIYKNWKFDLDQYPGMPAYLEIEGMSEEHIQEAIKFLELGSHKMSAEGERVLIMTEYGLNWYDMRF